jgi:hypothetical protein
LSAAVPGCPALPALGLGRQEAAVALGRLEHQAERAPVEHIQELLGRAQHEGRVALEALVLDQETEEHLERRPATVRARLPSADRRSRVGCQNSVRSLRNSRFTGGIEFSHRTGRRAARLTRSCGEPAERRAYGSS